MLDNQIIYGIIGGILELCYVFVILLIIVFVFKKQLKIAPILLISGSIKLMTMIANYSVSFFFRGSMDPDGIIASYAVINSFSSLSIIVFLGSILNYLIHLKKNNSDTIDLLNSQD